jgi:hypothetical protein
MKILCLFFLFAIPTLGADNKLVSLYNKLVALQKPIHTMYGYEGEIDILWEPLKRRTENLGREYTKNGATKIWGFNALCESIMMNRELQKTYNTLLICIAYITIAILKTSINMLSLIIEKRILLILGSYTNFFVI